MKLISGVAAFFLLLGGPVLTLHGVDIQQALAGTPDTLDNPELLGQSLPWLASQAYWTEFADPGEIALYDEEMEDWQSVPPEEFDLSGFNSALLGSPLPPPGVHPRIFFSPADLPSVRERFASSLEKVAAEVVFKRTVWDASTPDGIWYEKLARGDLEGLAFEDDWLGGNGNHQFKGLKSKIFITHTPHLPRVLAALSFYALMKDDEALGREVATVVSNYYKLREPIIDLQNQRGTPEYIERYIRDEEELEPWPNDLWRGMHQVGGGENAGLAYDYAAPYMTDEQKQLMRRVIAKQTNGKRSYGQNAPLRWRDTNWVGWDLNLTITTLAIEGEAGFDPDVIDAGEETLNAYLTWGISPDGTIFETNGKNGAGLDFALQNAVALARRGRPNYFGHPHLRKLGAAQIQNVVPAGGRNVNNGTYGCANFSASSLTGVGPARMLAAAYPEDAAFNWLLQEGKPLQAEIDPVVYRGLLERESGVKTTDNNLDRNWTRTRPDGLLSLWVSRVGFDFRETGGETWRRDHLGLPLDMSDEVHGQLNTRSSNEKDALYLMFEARPDLYVGGHQHHDAGHFYLSALGRDWGIEGNQGRRESGVHSVVLIDGVGQGDVQHCAPAKADYLGARITAGGAIASADLKHAYDYIWTTPMHYSWNQEERKAYDWEPETDPEVVRIFRGTQHYKARIWMHSYFNYNWGPTMRASYNPVQYAFRSAGLVRGKHPYAIIVDDIKKDDELRHYQWQLQVPDDVRMLNYRAGGIKGNDIVLGEWIPGKEQRFRDSDNDLPEGHPLLLVRILEVSQPVDGETRRTPSVPPFELVQQMPSDWDASFNGEGAYRGMPVFYKTLHINAHAREGTFRILLIPFRHGEAIPASGIRADGSYTLEWPDQQDTIRCEEASTLQTQVSIFRGSERLL